MFAKIRRWLSYYRTFVILDTNDSSITFSRALFRRLKQTTANVDIPPKVFVFHIHGTDTYAFTVNPDIDRPTQLADIQYNQTRKCIGIETLNPTVARILYDYGIFTLKPCKLSVSEHRIGTMTYFAIEKPRKKTTKHLPL